MSYTEELKAEIERVTLRGNPDKYTVTKLASILWNIDQRINALEALAPQPEVQEAVEEPVFEEKPKTTSRRVVKKEETTEE